MSQSQTSNKLVEAYVLIAIAILCMLGFSYRSSGNTQVPQDLHAVDGITGAADVPQVATAAITFDAGISR